MFRTPAPALVYTALGLTSLSAAEPPNPPGPADGGGTWQGRIESLVVDNFPSGTSRMRYFLHTSGETLELDARGEPAFRPGQPVEVTGRASGSRLAVSHMKAQDSAPATQETCLATGAQNAAVILVSFPSKALLSSVTPALMQSSFFGASQSLDSFLRESSFGQTWATGDVLGPFTLDADYFDQPLAARDAALQAAAATTDLTKYDRIFVVAPQGQLGMDSGGMALLGCGQISSPQGNLYASSIWLGAESMVTQADVAATAAHELGHGFGLEHAREADYGSEPLGPTGRTEFTSMAIPSPSWVVRRRSGPRPTKHRCAGCNPAQIFRL